MRGHCPKIAIIVTATSTILTHIDPNPRSPQDLSISFLGDIVTLHLVPGPMPPPPSDGNAKRSAKAKSKGGQKPAGGLGASIGDHRANHELIIAGIVGAIVSHFLFH